MNKFLKIGILLSLVWWAQSAFAQDTIPLNTTYSFEVNYEEGYTYTWWFTNEAGVITELESTTNKTEDYYWDTEGEFQIMVQAKDEIGCLSDIIFKDYVVLDNGGEPNTIELFAIADFVIGLENSLITGDVSTNDFTYPDNNSTLNYSLVGSPLPGLSFNSDGTYVFDASISGNGEFYFSYQLCLNNKPDQCVTTNVVITVLSNTAANNTKPIASPDVLLTFANQSVSGNVLDNDVDIVGGVLTVSETLNVQPSNGAVNMLADGTFNYTPNDGFIGKDTFQYQVCNSSLPQECDFAWVYVHVNKFDNADYLPPLSVYDDAILYEANKTFSVADNDYSLDGQQLVYNTTAISGPYNGELELLADGTFVYTPVDGYFGVDKFVYEVCGENEPLTCRLATVYILVGETNYQREFSAGNDTIVGSCKPYRLNASVSDTTGMTYLWEPDDYLDDPTLLNPVFTPGSTTTFILTLTSAGGTVLKDTVEISISDIYADAGDDFLIEEGTTALLDGTASFGKELSYSWTTFNGIIDSGENTATPIISSPGTYYLQVTDTFECVANDSLVVSLVTYAPVANDVYDTTNFQTAVRIPVLDNDYDPDGDLDPTTLSIQQYPLNGNVYINYDDYSISYTPNNGFIGDDIFEYQICDLTNKCDNASVFVAVLPVDFFIPEAFTPNGDNINDYFEIVGIEYYEGNSITIINRWGEAVYEAQNYGISTTPKFWDGKWTTGGGNEDLPTGTYFYVLDLGNGQQSIAGSIYIDR